MRLWRSGQRPRYQTWQTALSATTGMRLLEIPSYIQICMVMFVNCRRQLGGRGATETLLVSWTRVLDLPSAPLELSCETLKNTISVTHTARGGVCTGLANPYCHIGCKVTAFPYFTLKPEAKCSLFASIVIVIRQIPYLTPNLTAMC